MSELEVKKELHKHGLLDNYVLRNEDYKIGHDPYFEDIINNYSENEIVAFCNDDYTEGDVLRWLAEGVNYDLIRDCIKKHEIWD